jgi:hypothetical protein
MNQSQGPNQQAYHPFDIVLLSFVFFQKAEGEEVRILEDGLVTCMLQARCPRRETAIGILGRMVEFNLLTRFEDSRGVSYMRTEEGIRRTPPPPSSPMPRTRGNN